MVTAKSDFVVFFSLDFLVGKKFLTLELIIVDKAQLKAVSIIVIYMCLPLSSFEML